MSPIQLVAFGLVLDPDFIAQQKEANTSERNIINWGSRSGRQMPPPPMNRKAEPMYRLWKSSHSNLVSCNGKQNVRLSSECQARSSANKQNHTQREGVAGICFLQWQRTTFPLERKCSKIIIVTN